MTRDEFISRITAAIVAGGRKSGGPVDPASAAVYAASAAELSARVVPGPQDCQGVRRRPGATWMTLNKVRR
jgi:hypothetical protein